MAIRKRKKDETHDAAVAVAQTSGGNNPLYRIGTFFPEKSADHELYRTLREAVPIIDAAILKIISL